MTRGSRSLRADDRGNVAIIIALTATVLMGFAGLAIDAAMWEINLHKMQGAADQAALAALIAYQQGGGADPASTGDGVAAQFGFANGVNGASGTLCAGGGVTIGSDLRCLPGARGFGADRRFHRDGL